jgi:TPR repeat protein
MLRSGSDWLSGKWCFLDDGRLRVETTVFGTAVINTYGVTFDRETAVFKDSDGKETEFTKVNEFVSLDRAKDLTAKAKDLWSAKEYGQAVKLFREAAEVGYDPAQAALGAAYWEGIGLAQDYSAAIEWWKKAVAQGNTWARFGLGSAHAHGKGVPRDYAKAIQLLRDAADQGHAGAQNNLAWLYAACKDSNYHDGKKAVEYATKAVSHQPKTWNFVGTLSGAYARNGQFGEAIDEAKQAIELLRGYEGPVPDTKNKWLSKLADMSESFRKHQPYTDADD